MKHFCAFRVFRAFRGQTITSVGKLGVIPR